MYITGIAVTSKFFQRKLMHYYLSNTGLHSDSQTTVGYPSTTDGLSTTFHLTHETPTYSVENGSEPLISTTRTMNNHNKYTTDLITDKDVATTSIDSKLLTLGTSQGTKIAQK